MPSFGHFPEIPVNDLRALGLEVAARLRDAGHEAYFVGGCVRDRLLGLPLHDLDLATSAPPATIEALFPGSEAVGAHFGVVIVQRGGLQVQVATYRSDGSYLDGRRPSTVHFESTAKADVSRRDFTINAFLEDPFTGEVLDFVGGKRDLDAGLIRAIGDPAARFEEDRLRMLRAVRFAARLGFVIESGTMAAIRTAAPGISDISAERVRDELLRILTEGHARRGFELLDETGLLEAILPEAARMKGVAQPPQYHPEGDVWEHTLRLLNQLHTQDAALALAALLHDVAKPVTMTVTDRIRFNGHDREGARMAAGILARLKFPNQTISRAVDLIAQHMMFSDAMSMRESTFKRFVRQECFPQLLELYRMDKLAGNGDLTKYEKVRERAAAIPKDQLRPSPLLTGRDLISLGLQPGPQFAEVLRVAEDLQLEGVLHSPEQALDWARRLLKPAAGPETT